MGTEVLEEKMPPDFSDLTYEAQIAMEIVHVLPDKWDSTSGSYLGKELTILPHLTKVYEVADELMMLKLIMCVISEGIDITNDKIQATTNNGKIRKNNN